MKWPPPELGFDPAYILYPGMLGAGVLAGFLHGRRRLRDELVDRMIRERPLQWRRKYSLSYAHTTPSDLTGEELSRKLAIRGGVGLGLFAGGLLGAYLLRKRYLEKKLREGRYSLRGRRRWMYSNGVAKYVVPWSLLSGLAGGGLGFVGGSLFQRERQAKVVRTW